MNKINQLRSTLKTMLSRLLLFSIFTMTLIAISNTASAQGTATGPVTTHDVIPGPTILVGDPLSPIPIDLDPTGPPWSKSIFDNDLLAAAGGTIDMIETILNVGTEPWTDWHEHILLDPFGVLPSYWSSVVSLSINGNPITFNATGLGTKDLTLDTFSQPVLPGDIFTIYKQAEIFPNSSGSDNTPLMRIQEYPTSTIPEPSSIVLMAGAIVCIVARRRRR